MLERTVFSKSCLDKDTLGLNKDEKNDLRIDNIKLIISIHIMRTRLGTEPCEWCPIMIMNRSM